MALGDCYFVYKIRMDGPQQSGHVNGHHSILESDVVLFVSREWSAAAGEEDGGHCNLRTRMRSIADTSRSVDHDDMAISNNKWPIIGGGGDGDEFRDYDFIQVVAHSEGVKWCIFSYCVFNAPAPAASTDFAMAHTVAGY